VYNVKRANDIKCHGKVLHISIGEDTEGDKRYSCTLSSTSALDWGGGSESLYGLRSNAV